MTQELVVATGQFPVTGQIAGNLAFIGKLIAGAGRRGADIIHFPESSLSGYAGIDFPIIDRQQAPGLGQALNRVAEMAARSKIWVILGSHHFSDAADKPTNCLWLIDAHGAIVDRYDKRFLFGAPGEGEYAHYAAGHRPVTFTIRGIRCGLMICHEWRYPELYREQVRLGSRLVFQSWYDGGLTAEAFREHGQATGSLITGTVRGYAANNYLWISASNTSRRESCFPGFVVRPDGRVVHRLKRNVTGIVLTRIDFRQAFEDPSGPWRAHAMQGILPATGPAGR